MNSYEKSVKKTTDFLEDLLLGDQDNELEGSVMTRTEGKLVDLHKGDDEDCESVSGVTHSGSSAPWAPEESSVWTPIQLKGNKKKIRHAEDRIRTIWGNSTSPPQTPPEKRKVWGNVSPPPPAEKRVIVKYKVAKGARGPEKPYESSPQRDFFCQEAFTLKKNSSETVRIGNVIDIPPGYLGLVISRPGLACKHDIGIVGGLTTIVPGLDKMVSVKLYNHGDVDYYFKAHSTIASLIILDIPKTAFVYDGIAEDPQKRSEKK